MHFQDGHFLELHTKCYSAPMSPSSGTFEYVLTFLFFNAICSEKSLVRATKVHFQQDTKKKVEMSPPSTCLKRIIDTPDTCFAKTPECDSELMAGIRAARAFTLLFTSWMHVVVYLSARVR